jgi:hypothetical protein
MISADSRAKLLNSWSGGVQGMKKFILIAAGALALSGSSLDTVTGSAGTTVTAFPSTFGLATQPWISPGIQWTSAVPTPFWNNPSDDAFGTSGSTTVQHDANIGYLLTDTGGFATSPVNPVLGSDSVTGDYVAGGSGQTDPTFTMVRTAAAENISLLFASGGMNGINGGTVQIGYYIGGTQTVLYNSVTNNLTGNATGLMAFNPSANYGFYAIVCYPGQGCETYYSGQANTGPAFGNQITSGPGANPPVTGDTWNHFALFQTANGNWVIGFTEQNGYYGENYGDYQDAVLEITSAAAPEPGTIAIMGLGLAGLGLLGRKRFSKK